MRSMTNSPPALATTSFKMAQQSLPLYSHPKSPHTYTQHQLFACLALMQFFKTDLRGICQMLAEWSDLRQTLGLKRVPHYSTLCYARWRLLKKGASASFWQPC